MTLKLNHKLLAEVGNFLRGEWKPDSSLVAIMVKHLKDGVCVTARVLKLGASYTICKHTLNKNFIGSF